MTIQVTTTNRNAEPKHDRPFPASPFRLFEDFFNDWALHSINPERESQAWAPPTDVMEKNGTLFLKVEAPGVNEKEIELKIEGSTLTIRGTKNQPEKPEAQSFHQSEISYGKFSRSFVFPETVDAEKISASFKDGVLTVELPQKPETKPRNIKISTQ